MRKLLLLAILFVSCSAFGTTYYIAANGADTNNGTSTSTPWLHAPGMSTCTNTCASTTPAAGDSIIFRGGDTWHFGNSGLTPFAGFVNDAWNFTWGGTSSNCQLNPAAGTVTTSSCIYIGVDVTWYTGGSWTRPILNMDNTVTTSSPSSCSYEDSTKTLVHASGGYVIFDNFEVKGLCNNTTAPWASVLWFGGNWEVKNSYFHGWTEAQTTTTCGSCDGDEYWMVGSNYSSSLTYYARFDHNVVDGSDSTYGNVTTYASGGVLQAGAYEIDHNYASHFSDFVKYDEIITVHDNVINNNYNPITTGTHGNIFEWSGTGNNYPISTYYFNNLINTTNNGETIDMYPGGTTGSKHLYVFNNVMWSIGNGGNCYMVEGDGTPGPGSTYFFNNTGDSTCRMRSLRGSSAGIYQNNHFVGFSPATLATFSSMSTVTDSGDELFQTSGVASGQGYTSGNNYAPTSGGSTIGAGASTSSICSGMDSSVAQAACANGYGGVTYDATTHVVTDNAVTSRGSTWDIGAYQYSAGYTLTVTKSGTGSGTITSSDSVINCGATCSESAITSGTSITMSQSATSGSTFTSWGGTCGCSGTGSCGPTITASCTVTAAFALSGGVISTAPSPLFAMVH